MDTSTLRGHVPWATRLAGAGLAFTLAVTVGRAHAQASSEPTPLLPAPGAGAIEQVVVTAEHRTEFAKKVPLAITKISNRTIAELSSDGQDIRVLSAQVPSLYIESSFGRTYPRFYIRGLGNSDFTYNAQQPVSVVYDDVVEENAVLKAFPIFDVADVEILRGPQGTLFGRNTPAGVVKIDSVAPTDDYHGFADIGYGTYNSVNVSAGVGGAVIPHLLDFRVAVLEERRDDWITNTNPFAMYQKHIEGYSDFAGKGQLLYTPTADLTALLEVQGRHLDGTARVFRSNILQTGSNKLIPGFRVDQVNINGDDVQTEDQEAVHLTVNDTLGLVRITSITAYEHATTFSRGDVDGGNFGPPPPIGSPGLNYFPSETSDGIPGLDQVTQEIRVATTGDGRYFNQGGVFFFYERLPVDSLDYQTNGIPDVSLSQVQNTRSFSVFDSATYKITPTLTAGAGVRITTDHKTYVVACQYTCVAPPGEPVSVNHTAPTFNVDLDYAVTPQANVYGRIASGFLAPALDGRNVEFDFGDPVAGALTEAKAETTTSYEAGLKSTLLNNHANFDLTLFHWDTDDLQLTAVGGTKNSTQLLNAKKAVGSGVEVQLDLKPIDNLLVSLGGSYNFTKIEDPGLEVSGCAALCTVKDPIDPATGRYHINGNPLPNAPRFVLDARARYTMPLTSDTDIYLNTDWSYRSSVDYVLYQATEYKSQSLTIGGARIGYEDHRRGFELAAYVRNVLNQVRVTGAIDFDNLTGFVNDPRIVGGELKARF